MARRTKLVSITEETSRDNGKNYLLTEMGAVKTEKWAMRALLAITSSGGITIPEGFDAETASTATLAAVGIGALGKARWDMVEPLMDEMMECVQYQGVIGKTESILPMSAVPDAIEEVATLLEIQKELFSLHLGFSLADRIKSWVRAAKEAGTGI